MAWCTTHLQLRAVFSSTGILAIGKGGQSLGIAKVLKPTVTVWGGMFL